MSTSPVKYALLIGASMVSTWATAQGPGPAREPERARDLPPILRKAMAAGPRLRYSGRRLVEVFKGPKSTRHEEIISREGAKTRIEFAEGSDLAGQIIVEVGSQRKHFFPDRNEILLLPAKREEAFQRLGRLGRGERGSKLQVVQGDLVAGMRTEQVIVSDVAGNVTQRLYIEPKSGVLLKRTIFDPVGSLVAAFTFTQIDMSPPAFDASIFRIERKGATTVTLRDLLHRMVKGTSFHEVSLPVSSPYQLEASRIMKIGQESVLVQFYVWGNKRLSLFQAKSEMDLGRLRRFGPRNVHVYRWESQGRTWALVGNLEEAELARIAKGTVSGTP